MLKPEQENALALMNLLGGSEESALQKLNVRVAIFAGDAETAGRFASELRQLLERSLKVVDGADCDVEVAVGVSFTSNARVRVSIGLDNELMTVSSVDGSGVIAENVPGIFRKVAACYAAGNVIARAVGGAQFEFLPDPFVLPFSAFGVSVADLKAPIVLNDAVLAGAGGVANGFMWGLEELPVSGDLTICDGKKVGEGNLNRCLFFEAGDVGEPKAVTLAARTTGDALKVKPFKGVFHDLFEERKRVTRVFTTMDSRQARRSVQNDLPMEVLDASTTESTAVVIHSHRQPAEGACLSCIYPHTPIEDQRERHIADGLGLTVEETRRGTIDAELAEKLVALHSDLTYEGVIGRALDTLHKERCGQGALQTSAGQQAIAPLGFVSNLAGLLLALELVRFERDKARPTESTYMSVDPWRVPSARMRRFPSKLEGCECCGSADLQAAMRVVWPELHWPADGESNRVPRNTPRRPAGCS